MSRKWIEERLFDLFSKGKVKEIINSYDAIITGVSKNGKNTILYEITNKVKAKGFKKA